MNAELQTKVQASPAQNFTPVQTGLLQRKCALCNKPGLVKNSEQDRKKLTLQRSPAAQPEPDTVPPIVHEVLRSSGQPLDPETRAYMEPRFGHDFSKVRMHTNAKAVESARAVNALAYTIGNNLVFGRGYAPQSIEGKQLLAHELTHVVQQQGSSNARTLKRRVDSGQMNESRCRTRIGGFWLDYNREYIVSQLVGPDSEAINFALRSSNLLFLQRLTFGTSLYDPADSFNIAFRQALRNRFNLDIQNRTHHGRIRRIENRYQGVADLLQSGRARYRCGCDGEGNWAESHNNSRNNPRIWICRHFLETHDANERALTLLHEPLHILYGLGHGGTLNNINRYENFATDITNIPTPLPNLSSITTAGITSAPEIPTTEGNATMAARGGGNDIHTGNGIEPEEEEKEELIQRKRADQGKLTIGQLNDQYEQEADQMAAEVLGH